MTMINAGIERSAFGSNRRSWEYFDAQLTALRVNDVENIVARGRLLLEAREGSFEAMVKRHFDLSTARMYRIVGAHPVISNRCHVNALPPSMRTLYELTKLPEEILRQKLKDGSINPKLERKDVARWRAEQRGGQVEIDGKTIEHKPSVVEQLKTAKAEIDRLKQSIGGEHLFDPKQTNREIAIAMIGRLEGWRVTSTIESVMVGNHVL